MKSIFIFILLFSFSYSQADISKKIKEQSNYLNSKGRMEKRITRKLKDLAYEIIKQTKNLKLLKKKIDILNANVKANEVNIEIKYKMLNSLLDNNKKLSKKKNSLEKKIIDIVAKDFSYYLISDKNFIETKDSILVDEVLEKMNIILKKEFIKLSQNYEKVNSAISIRKKEIKNIKKEIDASQAQKKRLLSLKKQRESAINKLNREKRDYRARLERIRSEKISIRKTLEKLKILKKEENIVVKNKTKYRKSKENNNNGKFGVRQIGSSYQSSKVKRYRGRKTIAPLSSFVVKRKFGNYIDPIYHIKIFNDSVVLTSKIKNGKVRNILNGKVVFAKDTAVLDKVIIIENSNGIHTIYAHLSKIAPTVKVGKRIRKGYVIGRINNDLTFEVTQKNYHIDPLQLIRLN